jgi:hypothetical protein
MIPGKTLAIVMLALFVSQAGASPAALFSEDFDSGAAIGWSSRKGKDIALESCPAAGSTALRISDREVLESPLCNLQPSRSYVLKLASWSEIRGLFQVEVEEFDQAGKLLSIPGMERLYEHHWQAGAAGARKWLGLEFPFDTAANGGRVKVVIRKWGRESSWIDDVRIEALVPRTFLPAEAIRSAPNGSYTRSSLMLPGPDGVLYPNWSRAGLSEWQTEKQIFRIEDFGAVADDGKDDSEAFEKACAAAEKADGGTVLLGAGGYRLTRKMLITGNRVVIRGAGRDRTKLVFNLPDSQVLIGVNTIGARISPPCSVCVYFPGDNARNVTLSVAGKTVHTWGDSSRFQSVLKGDSFRQCTVAGKTLLEAVGAGRAMLKAEVVYADGSRRTTTQPFEFSNSGFASADANAVLTFYGPRNSRNGQKFPLVKSLRRGECDLHLKDASQIAAGDYVCITAPATDDWNRQSLNTCKWGNFRRLVSRVERMEGDTAILEQAARLDFPLSDKPYVEILGLIRNCAVEDFSIEQEGPIQKALKIGTILFRNAANCRAKNVTVINSGFRPLYATVAKNCWIADCTFNGAWNPMGTLAYAGFDYAWDCLVERLETFGMRHGPIFNWSCSGNVVRDSLFHESDAQWHAGWCSDNLLEQCRVESTTKKHSGYGYGFFATAYNDSSHGPNGPRNVIYNCDSISLKSSVYLGGGGTYNWLLMYNRFAADSGPGIIQRLGCRNNRIQGNVFILKDSRSPALYYEFMDSTGDVVKDNTVYGGNGRLFQGPGRPEVASGNRQLPDVREAVRPTPPVPSIYHWQLNHYK